MTRKTSSDRSGDLQRRKPKLTESDLAADIMGRNSLQGDDQRQVHNQRQAVPDERQEADSIEETAEKTDKHVRAVRDLGKGRRSSRGPGEGGAQEE